MTGREQLVAYIQKGVWECINHCEIKYGFKTKYADFKTGILETTDGRKYAFLPISALVSQLRKEKGGSNEQVFGTGNPAGWRNYINSSGY